MLLSQGTSESVVIWESLFVMTVIDVLIIGIVAYSLVFFVKARRRQATRQTRHGFVLIMLGLALVAGFYCVDLLTMHVLPLFMPEPAAMTIMRELHLNYVWFVISIAICAISGGLVMANRGVFSLFERLRLSQSSLEVELAARVRADEELRERERRYREIFEDSPVSLWEEDWSAVKMLIDSLAEAGIGNWREYFERNPGAVVEATDIVEVMRINQATVDIYRAPSKEAVIDSTAGATMSPGELQAFRDQLVSFAEGNTVFATEATERACDGTDVATRIRAVISPHHTDDWSQVLSTVEDVTERRRAEEQLHAAMRQADIANRAKSEFLSNMSHELRTPLNAIIGFSEMIESGTFGPVGDDKYVEYAEDIKTSGHHLLAVISDILDISKIEAGKLDLIETEVDIGQVVTGCLSLVRERAWARSLTMNHSVSADLPELHVDERKLKQILINLLSNAVKFTPEGGRIDVFARLNESGGIEITVSDTGIGIAEADIPLVLSPFGQVEGHLARKYEGTGLGLTLTKSLVELHGGSLALESAPDVGTTVTVCFPATRIVSNVAAST